VRRFRSQAKVDQRGKTSDIDPTSGAPPLLGKLTGKRLGQISSTRPNANSGKKLSDPRVHFGQNEEIMGLRYKLRGNLMNSASPAAPARPAPSLSQTGFYSFEQCLNPRPQSVCPRFATYQARDAFVFQANGEHVRLPSRQNAHIKFSFAGKAQRAERGRRQAFTSNHTPEQVQRHAGPHCSRETWTCMLGARWSFRGCEHTSG